MSVPLRVTSENNNQRLKKEVPIISRSPINVPQIPPLPPIRLVPPSTTAAMASSSKPTPVFGWAEASLAASPIPAIAEHKPEIA